jgi:V8-like Glu-specific endopeptidase
MTHRSQIGALLASTVLALHCGPPPMPGAQENDVGRTESELLNAAVTTARPEVGTFGFCTGTLIAPRYVISASHCFGHLSQIYSPTARSNFTIEQADGSRTSYPVERVFSFGYPIGSYDVALVRLTAAVPADVATPATIARGAPEDNSVVTVMGYGCTMPLGGADGLKRMRVTRLSITADGAWTTQNTLCPADSGGPIFGGTGPTAQIFGVNAQLVGSVPNQIDIYGQLPRVRSQIQNIWSSWELRGNQDISNVGWCQGNDDRFYYADVNADRNLDAICHNERSGRLEVAVGDVRIIRPTFTYPEPFCNGEGDELHLGDFNADRRTDLLCANRNSGDRIVLFSSGSGEFYSERNAYRGNVAFCRHPGSEIHTGDFNGDGRTDMLCHDRNTGMKWIDYASADTRSLFNGVNWSTDTNWCSHAGAQLHVADFNRDRRSDLLCHTRPNGGIDVKYFREGTIFAHGTDYQQTEANFCTDPEDTLKTWDLVGNGRAGLVCIGNSSGDGQSIAAHDDVTPFTISPPTELQHWSRVGFGRNQVRQWYITETGVANQPDQRDRRRDLRD